VAARCCVLRKDVIVPWKRHIMLFPILGPSSLPVMVAHPDVKHAYKSASVLEWYDRHSILVQRLI